MNPDKIPETVSIFVENLEALANPRNEKRAALARLKRCEGRSTAESREVLGLFYDLFIKKRKPSDPPPPEPPALTEREEEIFFLVATLFPQVPTHAQRKAPDWDFGGSLRRLAQTEGVNADGVDRRVAILLDADGDALPFRLRQALGMLRQKEVPVNWERLLTHLLLWEEQNDQGLPSGRVQRQWARSYFNLRDETPGPESGAVEPTPEETTDAD